MSIVDRARELRAIIEGNAQSMCDSAALEAVELFPKWASGQTYATGYRVTYAGALYMALQDHTSQADWTPTAAPSLFAKVLIPDSEVIYEWEQPGAENPYMTGDKVTHGGFVWVSLVDNNVWEPTDAVPTLWENMGEA